MLDRKLQDKFLNKRLHGLLKKLKVLFLLSQETPFNTMDRLLRCYRSSKTDRSKLRLWMETRLRSTLTSYNFSLNLQQNNHSRLFNKLMLRHPKWFKLSENIKEQTKPYQ